MERGPIAVIGAGTLGWQIARTFAVRGVTVQLYDASAETVERAMERIRGEAPEAVARIAVAESLAEVVETVWLAIEAIPERLEAKRALFAELSRIVGSEVVLATNSSSFRSRLLADATRYPERLLNTHFYNEPWRRSAVELMTCGATDPAVLEQVSGFMATCGMTPFVVRGESTGFIFNRIWRAIKRESMRVVAEGHATPEEVDRLWCLVMESAPGPFARMDRVGLDVVLDIERRYAAESGDSDDEPPASLVDLVERGMLGVKSGRGFYEYEG